MTDSNFVNKYLDDFSISLKPTDEVVKKIISAKEILINANKKHKKTMIFGNGGSAAIASHVSVDLTKNANIRCINISWNLCTS